MRTINEITKSLIKSYNNNERPNFIDLRDLEVIVEALSKLDDIENSGNIDIAYDKSIKLLNSIVSF